MTTQVGLLEREVLNENEKGTADHRREAQRIYNRKKLLFFGERRMLINIFSNVNDGGREIFFVLLTQSLLVVRCSVFAS